MTDHNDKPLRLTNIHRFDDTDEFESDPDWVDLGTFDSIKDAERDLRMRGMTDDVIAYLSDPDRGAIVTLVHDDSHRAFAHHIVTQ